MHSDRLIAQMNYHREGNHELADSIAAGAVQDGLLAQRRLDGDPDVLATDDHEELQRIISQGKRMEGVLREQGKEDWIKMAYKRARVRYIEEENCHDVE